MTTDRLVEDLWSGEPPAKAVKSVQIHVSRLRRVLAGDGNGQDDVLVTRPIGYLLRVAPGELDAGRFEGLLQEGRQALAAKAPERAAEQLREALALWRGRPLADLAYETFAQPEIARLEELRLTALEVRIEADLALGRHALLVAELERLVGEHPARERLHAQLMLALYRCGRQADALAAYRAARAALDAEFGLEPGPELKRLERAILRQDPALTAEPPPAAGVRISLCGPLGVEAGGRRVEDLFPGGKARLAFAYLVCHRDRTVGRDEVIGELWEEDAPAAPDAALSTVLSRVRRALAGTGMDVEGRGHLSLRLPPGTEVDVEAAAAAAATAETELKTGDPAVAMAQARQACDVLERPFLPDLSSRWVEVRRRELGDLRTDALETLGRAALRIGGGELATAARAARAAIDRAPDRESAYTLLMEAHAEAGNVAEALRVFDALRRRLSDELGVLPGPAAMALNERLLRHGAAQPAPPERPAVAPLPSPLAAACGKPMLGRARELAVLRGHAEGARAGERIVAMLAGEAGIGKTRLAAEFAREAHEAGWQVLHGTADEETVVPYQPFTEALRSHLRHAGLAQDATELEPLAELLPEIRRALPERREPAAADPAAARYRLFDAFAQAYAGAAGAAPQLLVLEDLHWADPPTLLLLRHVVRAREGAALLIVGTYRHGELPEASALGRLFDDLRRQQLLAHVEVGGLEAPDVAELAEALMPRPPAPAMVERLHAATRGNPFLLEEVLRELAASPGAAADAADPLLRIRIPEMVQVLMRRRLARLPEPVRRTLLEAAVAGPELDFELLVSLAGGEDPALAAVEQGLAAHILVELPARGERFAFAHALLRRTLYEMSPKPVRGRLHLRIGRMLEDRAPAAELAHHFFQGRFAGGADDAVRYAVQAAREERAAHAYEAAARQLRRAIKVHRRRRLDDRAERCELMLELARTLERAGDVEWSRWWFSRAAALAREARLGDRLVSAATGFAAWQRYGEVDHRAVALLEEALPYAAGPARARVLGLLATRLDPVAEQPRREQLWREGVALARQEDDADALAAVLRYAPYILAGPDGLDERLAAADDTVRLGEEQGMPEWALWGRVNAFVDRLEAGALTAADADLAGARRLVDSARHGWLEWHVPMLGATRAAVAGRLEEATELSERALALRRRYDPEADETAVAQRAMLAKLRGRLGALDRAGLQRVVDRFPRRQVWTAMLLVADVDAGRTGPARDAIERMTLPRTGDGLATLALLGEAAARLGDAALAGRIRERLAPYRDRTVVIERGWATWGPVERILGLAAAACGDPAGAAEHFEAALAREAGSPWGVHVACDYVELCAPAAPAVAAEALAAARAFGLDGMVARLGQ